MNKKRVLINNDNGRRDLLGLRLLEISLQRQGFETAFCNRHNLRVKLRSFRPHALLAARGDNPVLREASAVCKVYVVPGEGGRQTKETMLSVFMGRGYSKLHSVEWISRCYLWSKKTKDWLLETDLFKAEQLSVVGNPRLDIYRSQNTIKPLRSSIDRLFRLGVAVSATSTSSYYGHPHFAQVYHDDVHRDIEFPIVAPGRHFEDIVWRDHAILRRTIHTVKRYLESDIGDIWLRPNPLEGIGEYKFLEDMYPGRVHVMSEQTLPEFLCGVDTLLTCWSTTGLEALLLGLPTISISGTIDQEHLFRHISARASGFETFVPFYHLPNTEDELFSLIELAKKGNLDASPKPPSEVAHLLKQSYNWPSVEPASDLIAKDLVNDLANCGEASSKEWRQSIPMNYGIPVRLAAAYISVRSFIKAILSGEFKSYSAFLTTKDPKVEALIRKAVGSLK